MATLLEHIYSIFPYMSQKLVMELRELCVTQSAASMSYEFQAHSLQLYTPLVIDLETSLLYICMYNNLLCEHVQYTCIEYVYTTGDLVGRAQYSETAKVALTLLRASIIGELITSKLLMHSRITAPFNVKVQRE